jgi:hypothetical protein
MSTDYDPSGPTARAHTAGAQRIFQLQVTLAGVVVLFVGLVIVILARPSPPTYESEAPTTPGEPVELVPVEGGSDSFVSLIQQIGLALVGIGGVGVVFDLLNRNAQARALKELTQQGTENLADAIAENTAQAILGDARFVRDAITDENRRKYLESIILANIDDPAGVSLARRAAVELSGLDRLLNYRIRYEAADQPAPPERPYARVFQRLTKFSEPGKTFRFHFQVLSEEDDAKSIQEPDVYTWRYWIVPGSETIEEAWECFAVEDITINGVSMNVDVEPVTSVEKTSKRYEIPCEFDPADKYTIETVIRVPPPRSGGYVYFWPLKLTRGVDISCDLSLSSLKAIRVEALRTDNVELYKDPAHDPKIVGARTNDWVVPSAIVGFAFYESGRPDEAPSRALSRQADGHR